MIFLRFWIFSKNNHVFQKRVLQQRNVRPLRRQMGCRWEKLPAEDLKTPTSRNSHHSIAMGFDEFTTFGALQYHEFFYVQGVQKLDTPPPFPGAKRVCWMEHLELEFEAHIWWFCSAHEYCKTTKYDLRAPTLSASSRRGGDISFLDTL